MPDGAPTASHTKEMAHKQKAIAPVLQEPEVLMDHLALLTRGVQRAVLDPGRAGPADILVLQRIAGNRAVSRLVQTKATVQPPTSNLQRQEEEEEVQTKPLAATITPLIQREAAKTEQGQAQIVQRNGGYVDEDFRQKMAARRAAMGYKPAKAGPLPPPGAGAPPPGPQGYTGRDLAEKQEAAARLATVLRPRWQAGTAAGGRPQAGPLLGSRPSAPWQAGTTAGPGGTRGQFLGARPAAPEKAAAVPPTNSAIVVNKAHSRLVSGALTGDPQAQIKQVERSKQYKLFNRFDEVQLADDEAAHVKDKEGNVVWYRVKDSPNEYIRAEKILKSMAAPPEVEGPEADAGSKKAWAATEWTSEAVANIDERMVERARGLGQTGEQVEAGSVTLSESQQAAMDRESTRLTYAEGAAWAAGGILGMAVAFKGMIDDEATAWDRVEAAMNWIASGEGVLGGVTQIAAAISEAKTGEESTATQILGGTSSFALGFQEFFTTLASLVRTVKSGVDTIRMIYEQKAHGQVHAKREWVQQGTGLLTGILETLKGAARTARAINEAIGGALTGTFSQVCSAFAVGVDIFINVIKSVMQGYYLGVSALHGFKMRSREKELKAELAQKGHGEPKIEEARGFYAKREAMIATFDGLVAKTDQEIKAKEKRMSELGKSGKGRQALQDQVSELNKKKNEYNKRKQEIRDEIKEYESGPVPGVEGAEPGKGGPTRMELAEMELAGELGSVGRKRVVRQAIHLSTNLVQIAGSIATYVSGPGAPAAISLKAAAAGIEASLPFFRGIKQFGRNLAAKNLAGGQTGIANKIFNADKSTAAKLQARKKHAVTILMMVSRLNKLLPKSQDPVAHANELTALQKQATRVEGYIVATGCEPEKLYRANGKPQEQIKILVEELAKREF